MATKIYLLTCIATIIVFAHAILRNKNLDNLMVIFGVFLIINSFARYAFAVTSVYEVAVFATKMLYLAGCFSLFLAVILLNKYCNLKIPKLLVAVLGTFSAVMYGFVLSIGYSDIYYKSLTIKKLGDEFIKIKSYGVAHKFYPIMLMCYLAVIIFYLIKAIRSKTIVSKRTTIEIIGVMVITTILYLATQIFKLPIQPIAIGWLFLGVVLIDVSERIELYSISRNMAQSVEKLDEYGYIEFDNKLNFVGANSHAERLFPEIKENWEIDRPIPEESSFFRDEIFSWATRANIGEKKSVNIGELYYDVAVRQILRNNRRVVGIIIELVDRTAENKYLNTVVNYKNDLEKEVAKKTEHISKMKDAIVLGMATMVDSRDNSTGDHISRTSTVVSVFGKELLKHKSSFNIDDSFISMVSRAAPMHDLGKIAVDDRILRKNGKFTDEEFSEMKKHSEEGAKIVSTILSDVEDDEFVKIAVNVARYHHEKWNGKGYPTGILGKEIPLEARIMAFADVLDALLSKRCYKDAFSYDKSFGIIEEELGQQFDPELGKVFLESRAVFEELYSNWNDEKENVLS